MHEAMTEAAVRCKHSGRPDLKKINPTLFISDTRRPN
jgi:hypothetical protein